MMVIPLLVDLFL